MEHPDPMEFLRSSERYGPIGMAIVYLSNLEYAHDQFIVAVNGQHPELALKMSKRFPRQFNDKVDFLVSSIIYIRHLRRTPIFSDGSLNLQWLQYQLDELYQLRATLAHGSIFQSTRHPNGAVWKLDRYVKRSSEKNGLWGEISYEVGSTFLADAILTAQALKHYVLDLTNTLLNENYWEDNYKVQCKIGENITEYGKWMDADGTGFMELKVMDPHPTVDRDL
jgi:hypothetical protein